MQRRRGERQRLHRGPCRGEAEEGESRPERSGRRYRRLPRNQTDQAPRAEQDTDRRGQGAGRKGAIAAERQRSEQYDRQQEPKENPMPTRRRGLGASGRGRGSFGTRGRRSQLLASGPGRSARVRHAHPGIDQRHGHPAACSKTALSLSTNWRQSQVFMCANGQKRASLPALSWIPRQVWGVASGLALRAASTARVRARRASRSAM